MKRIRFCLNTGFANCSCKEIFEYEDGVSNEEIDEDFKNWVNAKIDGFWWEEYDD